MTAKSPANAAHDAARAEDEQRARAELHEYINSLERCLAERTRERDAAEADRDTWRHRAEVADNARATLNEHLAAAEKQLADVTRERDEARRERDLAQAAERTFALRLRMVHEMLGDPDCEVVMTSDLVAGHIRDAEERGARWALEAEEKGTDAWIDSNAARICAEARVKGGE